MPRSHRMLTATLFVMSLSPCLALADAGETVQGPNNAQIAMVRSASSPPATPSILTATVPTVRALDAELTGSEPDPEAFDRQGLDRWWQHHQQSTLPGDQK